MKTVTVNAMGDPCPIPVVKTKQAIAEFHGAAGTVETLVDNEIAVQNLTKMAKVKGYGVSSEKLGEAQYKVSITVSGEEPAAEQAPEETPEVCIPDARRKGTVVAVTSATMGTGSDELGAALMKAFLYALSQQDELPGTLLFYNGGAHLTCEGSPSLEDLRNMEAQGVEILTCGTCLNYYGLTDKLKIGGGTNMYDIVERLTKAALVVRP